MAKTRNIEDTPEEQDTAKAQVAKLPKFDAQEENA